jgi:hypothetical protein
MTETVPQTSHYVITAHAQRGFIQQTRARAASAIVLARRWLDAGYNDVEVLDPSGRQLNAERYRSTILSSGKFFR